MGQNLVSNPSFERVDTPVYWNSGDFINSSHFPPTRNVTNWDWYNSPDYFSAYVPYTGVYRGIPINDIGQSYPKHDSAYGGIIAFTRAGETKEYISQHLSNPLKQDSIYCLSFFASRADRVTYSLKNLGAYFSVNTPTLVTNYYINAVPQVVSSTYITDTIGWTEIQGCFTAQGGEEYITIGNFNSNANTDTLFAGSTNPHPGANGYAYYYIDSVSLWQNNFPTGINETSKENSFVVYPNPNNGTFEIQYFSKGEIPLNSIVRIVNPLGQVIQELNLEHFKTRIDLSNEKEGIYFYRILVKGIIVNTNKVVIIK